MEDWRFVDFSNWIGGRGFRYWIFSLFGFHLIPTQMTFFALSPVSKVWLNGKESVEFGTLDAVAIAVTFGAIVLAFVADKQMCDFRQAQYGGKAFLDFAAGSKKCYRGGLWNYSRHPNYFGEILFWFGMSLLAVADNPDKNLEKCPMHWLVGRDFGFNFLPFWKTSFGGAFFIFCLFFFYSAPQLDKRNLKNRDGYQEIMDEVPGLIPWFPRSSKKVN